MEIEENISQEPFLSLGKTSSFQIENMAFGGKGIAWFLTKKGKIPVFIPNTIPGQTVLAKVIKKKNSFAEAKLISVLKPSELETEISVQQIPGAPYISLPIEKQHEYKIDTSIELFKRIGKVENAKDKFKGLIKSPSNFNYRNRMDYAFSNKIGFPNNDEDAFAFGLGFKKRGQWALVENLDKESGLFDVEFENKLIEIRNYLEKTGLPAWNPHANEGFFRHLVVRKSFATNKLLINLITTSTNIEDFSVDAYVAFMKNLLGNKIGGLLHTINNQIGDRSTPTDLKPILLMGEPNLEETLNGLKFRISIESFFQPNPKCAELLYSKAVELALENKTDKAIFDLFCGTGTIAQLLAQKSGSTIITGIDIVPEAIDDAIENAKRNNIENVSFFAADVGKFLKENPNYNNKIGTIVLDPPRAGITPKALTRLIELDADNIVYVSCNPATQARDTEILEQKGYKLQQYWLVDQFPHTAHVECIAKFVKI